VDFDRNNPSLFDPLNDEVSQLPSAKGIYMIIARNADCIKPLFINAEVLMFNGYHALYIGISESQGLRDRDYKNHFKGTARQSTLRKSLGALHEWRDMRVYFRDGKYKFNDTCEEKLSSWMRRNLMILYWLVDENIGEIENVLINEMSPPLNLAKNKSPINRDFREKLKSLRK